VAATALTPSDTFIIKGHRSRLPHPRRTVEQTASLGQHRAIRDCAALAAPRQMTPARARDSADQHVTGPRSSRGGRSRGGMR
jgi:hypothetical protein